MKELPFTIASFDTYLTERKFMASRCTSCGALWLPPRPICLTCKADQMEWEELTGKGTLVAFTVIGVGPMPMIDAGYGRDNPYCVGIVQVEEGPRIGAQILGVDVAHPENIKIGTKVTADFVERGSWHFVEEVAKAKKAYLAFRA
ncbi:MAG: Zn-ribbon domain-containing OB-fold protein [Deltaproteobacteria bacterium]|nr:Zn-ribbon domain-containing OB-fold protein [Deltaproteobacteria bacterium]MBW2309889.1 Zn-ribbon domain-containing OB-fold protein [Deltaproteobacteria bacterium]